MLLIVPFMAYVSRTYSGIGILHVFEDMNFLCESKTKRNDAKFEENSMEAKEEKTVMCYHRKVTTY